MKKTMKKKSKRIPTRQRVKAEKKVREHNRKVRKEKKLAGVGKKSSAARKGIRIPNDCPFKEAVLEEVEAARMRKEAEKEARRTRLKEAAGKTAGARVAEGGGLEDMVAKAQAREEEFEDTENDAEDGAKGQQGKTEKSAKAFFKEFAKVVDAADVVLQVLDARDPLGTRSDELEKSVVGNKGKRLVIVLNKADLVPKDNLTAWVKYLQREFPTIPFKSSTQQQSRRLGQSVLSVSKATESQMQTSKAVGASTLVSLLANYCRNKDVKTSIRVGVVGYPNVGKSSLINSLKRGKVCTTGNLPGVTKCVQEVQLDSKVKLLDCPGMILGPEKSDDVQVALRNAIKTDKLDDLLGPVEAILQRCEKQYLQLLYNLPQFHTTHEFLSLLGKSSGKLKKGGLADLGAAARTVLNDWNGGRIKYYTHPPEEDSMAVDGESEAVVLGEFSKEFSLDSLAESMETDREQLPDVPLSAATKLAPAAQGPTKVAVAEPSKTKKAAGDVAARVGKGSEQISLKKTQKQMMKKEKKKRNRQEKIGQQLADAMASL